MTLPPPLDQLPEARPHHYIFAHQALRGFCAPDPLAFFAIMASAEQRDYLAWMWQRVEEALKEPATGLSVEEVTAYPCRVKDLPTLIITLPPPKAITEAHAVAIVLTGTPEAPGFRYFTLEYGFNLDNHSPRTVLCEWQDDVHANYGTGPEPTLADFAAAVQARL